MYFNVKVFPWCQSPLTSAPFSFSHLFTVLEECFTCFWVEVKVMVLSALLLHEVWKVLSTPKFSSLTF